MQAIILVLGSCVFVAVAYRDIRTRRIPNALTGSGMCLGLGLNALASGWHGLGSSFGGFAVCTILLLGPFALGGVGGGDVKMMGAVGALLGPGLALKALTGGLVLGGVFAVVHLARASRLREKLSAIGHMLMNAALARSVDPLRVSASSPHAVALPYSVPLGIGTLGAIALSVGLK